MNTVRLEALLTCLLDDAIPSSESELEKPSDLKRPSSVEASNLAGQVGSPSGIRRLIHQARTKLEKTSESDRTAQSELLLERWRRAGRERYSEEQAKRGRSVRVYRRHEYTRVDHPEPSDERAKRQHRERQRGYRGKDAITARPRNDLSMLTAEEKKEYYRAAA